MPRELDIIIKEGNECLICARFPILFHRAMR